MASIDERNLALVKKLYYEEGLSMRQIGESFHVHINAVVYFMRRNNLPRRDRFQANKQTFDKKPLSFSIPTSLTSQQKKMKDIAVAIYWAEGAKRGTTVDLANSDADMIRLFLKFLRQICRVDETRIRGYIYCHENQNHEQLLQYWSRVMHLPTKQFTKVYIRKGGSDGPKKRPERMGHGLVHIRYSDLKLLRQILAWIDEIKQSWVGTQAVNEVGL